MLVFGSLNADLTVRVERFPDPGETLNGSELVTAPGGKSSNQAVAAALLGSSVRLVGAVGDDAHGRFLLDQAREAGVDVSQVRADADHATGSAMIVVDASGENTIIVSPGANGLHTAASAGETDVAGADVLCLCLEVPLNAVEAAARRGHEAGALVVLNLSPYTKVPSTLLGHVDVLLVNQNEAELVVGREVAGDWAATLEAFIGLGVDRVVVTLGAEGAVVLDGTGSGDHELDRTGSGHHELDRTGSGHHGLDRTGSGHPTGSGHHELDRTGSGHHGLDRTGSGHHELDRTGSGHHESGRTGSGRTGSGHHGPDRTGPDRVGR
ncbi:MAG: ribokinase [Ornithinimicrobium sp.]